MLETVREFGLEQLDTSGESERIGRRHADWGVAFVEHIQRTGGLSQGRGRGPGRGSYPTCGGHSRGSWNTMHGGDAPGRIAR